MNTKESHNEDAAVNQSWSYLGYIQELKHPGTFVCAFLHVVEDGEGEVRYYF